MDFLRLKLRSYLSLKFQWVQWNGTLLQFQSFVSRREVLGRCVLATLTYTPSFDGHILIPNHLTLGKLLKRCWEQKCFSPIMLIWFCQVLQERKHMMCRVCISQMGPTRLPIPSQSFSHKFLPLSSHQRVFSLCLHTWMNEWMNALPKVWPFEEKTHVIMQMRQKANLHLFLYHFILFLPPPPPNPEFQSLSIFPSILFWMWTLVGRERKIQRTENGSFWTDGALALCSLPSRG